jgi:WD40 repeat protein
MYLLNDFYLLIGGYENNQGIYIIDVIKYQLIKQCLKNLNYVDSIIRLYNGTLLVGAYDNNKYSLINYKINNLDFIKIKSKESVHKGEIFCLIATNDGIVISCSDDSTIKIWK